MTIVMDMRVIFRSGSRILLLLGALHMTYVYLVHVSVRCKVRYGVINYRVHVSGKYLTLS